jgi:hypothetical protein
VITSMGRPAGLSSSGATAAASSVPIANMKLGESAR